MAVAKWGGVQTRSSNFAGTTLNSLANNSTSAFVTYDNSTGLHLYGVVTVKLGSITPTTGGSITLRVYTTDGTDTPDNTGSVGGGDAYTHVLTTSASAKTATFPIVRIYPFSLRMQITNNAGVALAASGNELYVTPYGEDVS